jgi:hypothetical protein
MSWEEQPNFNYVESLAGDDHEFRKELMDIIKKEFPREKEIYEISLSRKRYKECAAAVHKLKHKINIFGLEQGYQIAKDHENHLRTGSLKGEIEFQQVLESISAFIEEI